MAAPPVAIPLRPDVSVVVMGVYDTNVSGVHNSAVTPLTAADYILIPNVAVSMGKALGRQQLYFNGAFSYNFYKTNTILNSEQMNLNGGAQLSLGPCQPTIRGGYDRRQSSQEDLLLQVIKNKEDQYTVGGTLACARTIGLSPVITVTEFWDHNTNPTRQIIDSHSFSASAGISYARPSLGAATLFGSYDDTRYPNRQVLTAGGIVTGDEFNVWSTGLRYSRSIGARLTGDFAVSYTYLKPKVANILGSGVNKGVGYSFDLTYRATGRLTVHGTFARTQGATNRTNATYVTSKTYGGDIGYQLGPRINVSGGATYTTHDYSGATPLPGAGIPLTHEENKIFFGNVRYDISPKLFLTLNASHNNRNADLALFSYSNTRVSLSAGTRF